MDGYPAIQYEISCDVESTNDAGKKYEITYLISFIKTPNYYYQLSAYALQSDYTSVKKLLLKIEESFKIK